MNETLTRMCTSCNIIKPLTEEYFYKDDRVSSGFDTKCKDCIKSKYRNYRNKNFDIITWYEGKSDIFKRSWSLDNILWLYNNYNSISKQDINKKFPDSNYKTINNIICQWDIRKVKKNDIWSNEDISFLTDNYPNMPQEELEKHFVGRTWNAIKGKANKLRILRSDDMLIKINSEAHKGYIMPEEQRRKLSRSRRREKSANWKGGLTPLHTYFRSVLYEWKLDSLKAYDFKCALTKENNGDLEIHHINENFSNIILETLNLINLPIQKDMTRYSEEELKLINKTFLDLNYKYGLGIPIKKSIHHLYHSMFGKENNNKEEFDEFIQRYKLGEFTKQLEIIEDNYKINAKKNIPSNGKKYRKLIKSEVIEIKKLILKNMPDRYIANLYKVSETAIYNIRTNKTWTEININDDNLESVS